MMIIHRAQMYSLLVINLASCQLLTLIDDDELSDEWSVHMLLIHEYSQWLLQFLKSGLLS